MSKLLKRYALAKFVNRGGENDKKMMIEPDGPWVNHDDYAELKQERNRLRAALDAIAPGMKIELLSGGMVRFTLGGDDE